MYSLLIELKRILDEKDSSNFILDIAKLFKLDIEHTRLNDYEVICFDVNNLSAKIKDNKNEITYESHFSSSNEEILIEDNINYIITSLISKDKKIKKIYNINEVEQKKESMLFIKDDKALEFVSDKNYNNSTFTIRYLLIDNNEFIPLLTRMEQRINKEGYTDIVEKEYTYKENEFKNNTYSKTTYLKDDSLIYVIDDISKNIPVSSIKGLCLEKNDSVIQYIPKGMSISEKSALFKEETISSFVFKGAIEDCIYSLEIHKNKDSINIDYYIYNDLDDIINHYSKSINNLNTGSISIKELETIKSIINIKDDFLNIVINEISHFILKMYEKNKLLELPYEPLSPRTLFNRDFDLIDKSITESKSDYFSFIDNYFNNSNSDKIIK